MVHDKPIWANTLAVVAVALTTGCVATHGQQANSVQNGFQDRPQWREQARRFNKQKTSAAALFANADRVQVFRLFSQRGKNEQARGKLLGGISYFAQGKQGDKAFAARLAATVLNPASYWLPGQSTKQCYIDPGVAFRVWSGKRFADVIVCFECNQLVVLENNPKIPESSIGGWLTGRFTVAGDFDPARQSLVALSKEGLPDSPEIQKL